MSVEKPICPLTPEGNTYELSACSYMITFMGYGANVNLRKAWGSEVVKRLKSLGVILSQGEVFSSGKKNQQI